MARLFGHLLTIAQSLQAVIARYRTPLFALCAALFLVGLALSIDRLAISWNDIDGLCFVMLAVLVIPATMIYGALNFMVMARGAGASVPFAKSLKISCVAAFAEFLPIPGGALVRGGALVKEGAGTVDAGLHVTVNALLWIACAAIAASLALGLWHPVALAIGMGGLAVLAACLIWLTMRAGAALASAALVMRLIGLVLAGARIGLAFFTIGAMIGWLEIYPFVFAAIAGSAAAIAPGGIGISEMIAAALATISAVPPETAFIAVALNRLTGFAISGIATFIIAVALPKNTTEN